MNWIKKTRLTSGLRKKKRKLLRFMSFWVCPIPTNQNSEISEIWLSLQILTAVAIEDLKTNKE